MLKAPSRYNPAADPIASATRAQVVIDNMVDADLLTEEQAQQAGTQSGEAAQDNQPLPPAARYFADWALDQVSSYIGITTADLVVQTTLDPRMQGIAERDLAAVLAKDGPKQHASEGALVALTPDGAVRALVGGVDYKQSQYNRATQALRQPGSSFKAFVYLAAFEAGLTPDAQFVDAPISIGKWSPDNYNDKYFGQVTLREAFARSLNSVAVQLAQRVTPAQVVETAKRLGIDTPLGNDASIALGTSEVHGAGDDRRLRDLRQQGPWRAAVRHHQDRHARRPGALSARRLRPRHRRFGDRRSRDGRHHVGDGRLGAPARARSSAIRRPARPAPARTITTPGSSA